MVRKRALTESQVQDLAAEYRSWDPHDPDDKRSIEWLGEQFGVSKSTVFRELRRVGEPHKPTSRPLTQCATPSTSRNEARLVERLATGLLECNTGLSQALERVARLEMLLRDNSIAF